MAGIATNDFVNQQHSDGAAHLLNAVTQFTPDSVNQYMAPAGAGLISGVTAGVDGGLQTGLTTGIETTQAVI